MGEYARLNGHEIKIGTCESMYYLRWDDRHKVKPVAGNVDPRTQAGLFFRLPFPDEDGIGPGGNYEPHRRGYRLGHKPEPTYDGEQTWWVDWTPDGLEDADAGSIQLRHECGLLLNVPCHHGAKLPEVGDCRAFWNGKSWSLELCSVKSMPGGTLRPVYHCRHCGSMWSTDWDDILPFCGLDAEMLRRLERYAEIC